MTDAIISGLVKRVKDEICIEVGLLRGVKEKALKLAGTLETIKNVLEDAERKEVKNVTVRSWLTKLEHTAYQMDDILDEWKYHELDASAAEKVRCSSFIPFLCLYFKKIVVWHRTAKKIENVQASLEEILKEKDQFHFLISDVPTINSATRLQSTSMIDVDEIDGLGIQRNKDDIVERLMNDGDRQQILSVVGMGGIGKTTLARLVYNDGRVNGCFNLRIWICVSHPFDVAGIASEIIENVEKKGPPNTKLLQQLLQKLGDCISGKKFLLVLDDVWNDDYNKWECLKLNLNSGAAGSKILVTTRKEGVAKMMGSSDNEIYHPQLLTSEEC